MPRWTKESALQEIDILIREIDPLRDSQYKSAEHIRWLTRTHMFLEQAFGAASLYYVTLCRLQWHATGTFFTHGWDIQNQFDQRDHKAYLRDLDSAKGLLQAAHDELSRNTIEEVYHGKGTGPETSDILKVLNIVESRLRKVVRQAPNREKDIQDSFENLLIGADIEYSRETDSIEYSSKTYIPDFSLRRLDLAIEIKLCNRVDREKVIIAEINDDILAYKQNYGNVLFVIYDIGFIRDVERFVSSLEETDGILVKVVKH